MKTVSGIKVFRDSDEFEEIAKVKENEIYIVEDEEWGYGVDIVYRVMQNVKCADELISQELFSTKTLDLKEVIKMAKMTCKQEI